MKKIHTHIIQLTAIIVIVTLCQTAFALKGVLVSNRTPYYDLKYCFEDHSTQFQPIDSLDTATLTGGNTPFKATVYFASSTVAGRSFTSDGAIKIEVKMSIPTVEGQITVRDPSSPGWVDTIYTTMKESGHIIEFKSTAYPLNGNATTHI